MVGVDFHEIRFQYPKLGGTTSSKQSGLKANQHIKVAGGLASFHFLGARPSSSQTFLIFFTPVGPHPRYAPSQAE